MESTHVHRENLKTYFAPPERLSFPKALAQYRVISTHGIVKEILNALPYITFVLNSHRQVIFSNDVFLERYGFSDVTELVGERPGEVFRCVNHDMMEAGCGTSRNCKYCDALGVFLESRRKSRKISRESRLIALKEGKEIHYDFQVTATPFLQNGEEYTILTINDISDEKRRRALEKVFFHDLLNIAGGLNGLIDLTIKNNNPEESKQILMMTKGVGERLVEEICFQNDLLAAENGEMKVVWEKHSVLDVVEQAIQQIRYHDIATGRTISVDPQSVNIVIQTDSRLLKRILINMIKNALEAISKGDEVTIGCYRDDECIDFVVSNPGYMEEEVQAQLFQRSFSTKGSNRGIGTYSMKMFVEQYLGGNLSFSTSRKNGTSFKASFPVS